MNEQAWIECHREQVLPGRCTISFEWQGLRGWPVMISRDLIEDATGKHLDYDPDRFISCFPESLNFLPWPLRLVSTENTFVTDCGIYVRTDSGFWLYWYCRFKAIPFLQKLKSRIIFTFMVWGLAYVREGEILSWRCIGRKRP